MIVRIVLALLFCIAVLSPTVTSAQYGIFDQLIKKGIDAVGEAIEDPVEKEAKEHSPKPTRVVRTGAYNVRYPTFVYSDPSEDSRKITRLEEGTKVNVVGVRGDWLEIRSKHGRPPGFIKKDSVVPIGGR